MDWLLAAALAATVIVGAAGVDVEIGGVPLRSHSPARVLAVAVVLFAVRARMGIGAWPEWLLRMTLLTCIVFSAATWLRFLLTTIGGADSYGYVSTSQMLLSGRLSEPAPLAGWLTAANSGALSSPLGWAPAPNGAGIVPNYPLGLPIIMAMFSAVGGVPAVFLVAPVLAIVTLALVYRIAREWFDHDVALVSAMVTAWNPVFIAYAKQPMSDVPASAAIVLATALALRSSATTGFIAGLAAGFAVMIRPALLVAAAVIPLIAYRGPAPRPRALAAAAGAAIGVGIQALLQAHFFGDPLATGYGSAQALFSASFLPDNLSIYSRQLWSALTGMWVAALIVGVATSPAEARRPLFDVSAAVLLPYLFYLPFDHWETLRFLLPALVLLTVFAAAGLVRIAQIIPRPAVIVTLLIVFSVALVVRTAVFLRDQSAWNIRAIEERYPLAGQWVKIHTPPNSVVFANQHSGSLRWYGERQTLRWDLLAPESLAGAVRDLEKRGQAVYAALEGKEVEMFETRFAGVIDQLQVDHVGRVRNVHFRRLSGK